MAIKFLNTVQVDTDVLYVDAANNRVGIGTTSPISLLHLNSSTGHSITSTYTGQETYKLEHGTSGFYVKKDNVFLAGFTQNHDLTLHNTSGVEYARFDGSSGNVGIGTTSPGEKLEVNGNIKADAIQLTTGAADTYVLTSDATGNASWAAASGGGSTMLVDDTTPTVTQGGSWYSPVSGVLSIGVDGFWVGASGAAGADGADGINASSNIDGGAPDSVYTPVQVIDGGTII